MQRAEMEELRHREANNTALQAIGPRKKPKLDSDVTGTSVVRYIISIPFELLFTKIILYSQQLATLDRSARRPVQKQPPFHDHA